MECDEEYTEYSTAREDYADKGLELFKAGATLAATGIALGVAMVGLTALSAATAGLGIGVAVVVLTGATLALGVAGIGLMQAIEDYIESDNAMDFRLEEFCLCINANAGTP